MSRDRVAVFPWDRGRVLLSRTEGADPPVWDAFSVAVEDDPEQAAARAVCGFDLDGTAILREGPAFETGGGIVRPYLLACDSSGGIPEDAEWVHATEIRRRETGEWLWRAYREVAPSVDSVREDRTHGSAFLSIRALEVLRDRAGEEADWPVLVECATDLLEARPSMAALGNRVDRAMSAASETASAEALQDALRREIDRAAEADERAAVRAAERIEGTVLTLSRSGTVREALLLSDPDRVIFLESRPGCEGVGVAADLADAPDVTLTLDAAVSHAMTEVDTLLVGADTVLADASVVNKVGTRTAAGAAARESVPVYAVAAADKISPSLDARLESIDRESITENDSIGIDCPLFDRTPADLVTGVITEAGVLGTGDVQKRAAEHGRRSRWKGPNPSEE